MLRCPGRLDVALALAVAAAACTPPPPPPPPPAPPPAPPVDDAPEVESDGESSLTVLERPDHPAVKTPRAMPDKPLVDRDCRARKACPEQGLCSAKGTTCIAASYADCEQMPACALGKCTFDGQACQPVADCRASWGCQKQGLCAELAGKCAAADAAGCQQSEACTRDGRCSVDDGHCVAKVPKDCADATVCQQGGQCEVSAGTCVVTTDGQCRRSKACREEKRCLARDGVCVESCATGALCGRFGRCRERKGPKGMSCVALADASCEAAAVCEEQGLCTAGVDGLCIAGDDVECLRSAVCKEDGRCRARRGRCVPTSDAECKQAVVACGREGRCRHDGGRCVR